MGLVFAGGCSFTTQALIEQLFVCRAPPKVDRRPFTGAFYFVVYRERPLSTLCPNMYRFID